MRLGFHVPAASSTGPRWLRGSRDHAVGLVEGAVVHPGIAAGASHGGLVACSGSVRGGEWRPAGAAPETRQHCKQHERTCEGAACGVLAPPGSRLHLAAMPAGGDGGAHHADQRPQYVLAGQVGAGAVARACCSTRLAADCWSGRRALARAWPRKTPPPWSSTSSTAAGQSTGTPARP